MVAVSTQGLALATQTESARADRMAPSAHGVPLGFATNSSNCQRCRYGQPETITMMELIGGILTSRCIGATLTSG